MIRHLLPIPRNLFYQIPIINNPVPDWSSHVHRARKRIHGGNRAVRAPGHPSFRLEKGTTMKTPMIITLVLRTLICIVVSFMLHSSGHAEQLVWRASRAEVVEAARNSGKLILLLAGRDTCGNCQYMKNTICEFPSVRQVLDTNYICWYCPIDTSTEWYPYATGLGSFTLPLMCVIEPGNATNYLDRTTATQSLSVFEARMGSHLPTKPISVSFVRTTTSKLLWTTESQLRYRVLCSEDLVQWTFIGDMVVGDGSQAEVLDPTSARRRFYRLMGFR